MKNQKEIREYVWKEYTGKIIRDLKDEEHIMVYQLKIDFMQLLSKNPGFGKQLISYYFEFMSCIEITIENLIRKEIEGEDGALRGKTIDNGFKVEFTINQFPRVKLNYKSFSMINSMVKTNSGCVIFLPKLFVLEISKSVNFAKKFLYRKNCGCCKKKTKLKKNSLREYIKLNCEQNNSYSVKKIPSCYDCKTKMVEDKMFSTYASHKIMKVALPSDGFESQMELYVEDYVEEKFLRSSKLGGIKVGDELSGLFYLDHLLKYSNENGRLVGNQKLHLIAIDLKLPEETHKRRRKATQGIKRVNYFQKSYRKNYEVSFLKKDRSIDNEAFNTTMVKILSENIKSLNEDHWLTNPLLTLVTYMGMFSHLTNMGKFNLKGDHSKVEIVSKLGDLNSMFIMFWTRDITTCVRRIEELCSYYTNVVFFPSYTDEKSLRTWFVLNKKSLIVVPNFMKLDKKMAEILHEVLEKRHVTLKGSKVRVNPTIIVLLNPDFLKKPKKFKDSYPSLKHDFKSHFIDSFDMCINLVNSENKYKSVKNGLTHIDSIHSLCNLFAGESIKEDREDNKSVFTTFSKTPQKSVIFDEEEQLSQHTRVSNLCKRVINRYNFKSPSRKVKKVRKEQIQEMLSTELPKKNFTDGINLLESYLEEAKYVKKFSLRNIKSLKKIVLNLRIFRLTSCGFYSMIKSLYSNFNKNKLQTSIFDSLFAIALFEESMSNLNGLQTNLFDNLCSKFLVNFCDSVISQKNIEEFQDFYIECKADDICDSTKHLQDEIFKFCGVSC